MSVAPRFVDIDGDVLVHCEACGHDGAGVVERRGGDEVVLSCPACGKREKWERVTPDGLVSMLAKRDVQAARMVGDGRAGDRTIRAAVLFAALDAAFTPADSRRRRRAILEAWPA